MTVRWIDGLMIKMMRKYIVSIFGVALNSNNYGCTALGISQILMLEKIAKKIGAEIEYYIYSDEDKNKLSYLNDYLPLDRIEIKEIVRIKHFNNVLNRIKKSVNESDIVIDLTYGDSFSDIYGFKNFALYSLPKIVTIKSKKTLILGPQTIGPFNSKLSRIISKKIVNKTNYVISRDGISAKYCYDEFGVNVNCVTSDLAMELPYDKNKYSFENDGQLNIGLNISKLLWDDYNKFNFKLNYKTFTYKLIETLIHNGYRVHLITHVYDKSEDNEYTIAKEIGSKYQNVIVAPYFDNPIDAKSYMSNLDFFIGARMHATIGAFSSGVPVAPIAYSRKFMGLYNEIDYPYCVDCTKENETEAINKIMDMIDRIEFFKERQKKSYSIALNKNLKYKELLTELLTRNCN